MTHIIAAGRVFLRPFEAADAETYRRWRADAEPMALAGWHELAPLSLAQVEKSIAGLGDGQGKDGYAFLICLVEGERPIGEVLLMDIDRVNGSAEVGIFIGEPDEWGKGYGTDAVRALVDSGSPSCASSGSGWKWEPRTRAPSARTRRLASPRRPHSDTIAGRAGDTPMASHVDPPRRVAEPPLLTERALNRALLARQLLLERASLRIPEALSRLGGIQNQYAPNAYIRLWSCLAALHRDDLTRAYEDASVVQGTLMRGTIHTVAQGDYRLFLGAVAPTQREWAARATKAPATLEPSAAVTRVRAELAAGPMKRPALIALLRDEHPAVRYSIDTDLAILRVPPSGTWERRRADLCALADDVIGPGEEVPEPSRFPRSSSATWRPSARHRSRTSRRSWG